MVHHNGIGIFAYKADIFQAIVKGGQYFGDPQPECDSCDACYIGDKWTIDKARTLYGAVS